MHSERGVTLIELIVVVVVGLGLAAITVAYSMPWMIKESVRSALYDVNGFMQMAKVEAVSRNRPVRFVINTTSRQVQVWDSLGTSSTSDDSLLHVRDLPTHVIFDRPDTGSAITLDTVGTDGYEAVFTPDGMLSSSAGVVCLAGSEAFGSVSIYAAGGIEVFEWNGTEWKSGF